MKTEDIKVIETIKSLALDMINEANSGHPGIVLGAAPIIYTLFAHHLNFNPEDPNWFNRDRFVLSAGHGSALLYATLYLAGYKIETNDLKSFRKIDSILPGHPERGLTPGVELTTGPLAQGLGSAVGMALAEKYLSAVLTDDYPKQRVIDHYTYCLCGDGDLMEGLSYEAASFAGANDLNKLIVLYDSNDISLDDETKNVFNENILKRFDAMGWNIIFVKNGEDVKAIDKAIIKAKSNKSGPTIIQIKTTIGTGSVNAGKNIVHGVPLDKQDLERVKAGFSIREVPFAVSKDATVYFRDIISKRCEKNYANWNATLADVYNIGNEYVKRMINFLRTGEINLDFDPSKMTINSAYSDELRNSNGEIMNLISERTPFFLGGSADLWASTKTKLYKSEIFTKATPTGKNIAFGVREHAMGAILNGMATYGLKVFGSTFLAFSDYLKPAIRMSALMNLPVTHVFTHDSVSIGQDGPTHEPVEQLAMLRAIPNLSVFRPADINEIIGAWYCILKNNRPAAIVISKDKVNVLNGSNSSEVAKGAYIIRKEINRLDGIIVATGTEVGTAIDIANELYIKGIDIRVVSMPCVEIYNILGSAYHEALFPIGVKVVAIEASNDPIWYKFTYNNKMVIRIDDFGYSGAGIDVLKKFGFDYSSLLDKVEKLLK